MNEDAMRILRIYADKHGQAMGIGLVEVPTLRDQFAMAALTSLLSSPSSIGEGTPALAAKLAYRFADAMLEARKEKK
jgi:hypothetical protein